MDTTSRILACLLALVATLVAPTRAQEATDVPESAAEDSKQLPSSSPCGERGEMPAWIDTLNYSLYQITCSAASWFDGLFGNRRYDQEYRQTHGYVTTGLGWSQRDGLDPLLRFRVRVQLPQTNNRFNAFVGRSEREDFVTEAKPDAYVLPAPFANQQDDQVYFGLGYRDSMSKAGSFDADFGVRVRFPLDPYVKGSYRWVRPLGERNLIRLRETVFWQKTEQFGVTSLVEWDRVMSPQSIWRWTNSATFSQETEGVRWYSTMTLFTAFDRYHALAYQGFANGSSDRPVPLTNFGGSLIYRQRIWRDWLLIELRAGVDWPRWSPLEERKANPNGGVAFEMRYGHQ